VELEDAYPAIRRGRGLQLRGESDRRQAERARVQIEEARGDGVTVDATTGFLILHLPSVQPQRPEGSPVRRRQPLYLPGRLIAECGEPAVEPAPPEPVGDVARLDALDAVAEGNRGGRGRVSDVRHAFGTRRS
jgi:hypothetical protein